MTLSERLATPQQADARRPRSTFPREFAEQARYVGQAPVEAAVNFKGAQIPQDEQRWREEIARVANMPIPDHRRVELRDVRYWGDKHDPYIYCKFAIVDREPAVGARLDLDDIIRAAKAIKRTKAPLERGTERALVVAIADMQIGKVGSRGDTESLLERVLDKLDALEAHAKRVQADAVYLVDLGDGCENVENVSSQLGTNDLSLPEQLRVGRRIFTEFAIRLAALHSRVVCATVPSNHTQWRRGKGLLGKPGDDWGIENLTAIADAFSLNPAAFGHVSFVVPDAWQETIALDVFGTIIALAHGHQVSRPEQIPLWWAKQVHGGQPCADADILLTGHFHTLRVQPTGRSAHTGRAKYWLMCPTLDNSSDWYRLRAGDDSDPGLVTFTVDANGWDNLKVF